MVEAYAIMRAACAVPGAENDGGDGALFMFALFEEMRVAASYPHGVEPAELLDQVRVLVVWIDVMSERRGDPAVC